MYGTIEHNKELIQKYPWLWPNDWYGERISEDKYDYTYTFLDEEVPEGWRKSFMEPMCEEIQTALVKYDCVKDFHILQIKEKFGWLRFYFGGVSGECLQEVRDIISKYEKLSYKTCSWCGKPARWISRGWICPFCNDCAQKQVNDEIKLGYIPSDKTIADMFDKGE